MVELNLLPDVKLEYIKAERLRRLMFSAAFIVTIVSILILVLLLGVDFAQKKHINDLKKSIASESSTLQNKPDIAKILTVQNQLESLTGLHAAKPAASRLFSDYLNEVTPATASINSFTIDFGQSTVAMSGMADSLATINKYVDTLKFTTYTTDSNSSPSPAFSSVVLAGFGLQSGAQDQNQAATYNITFSFDKNLFDITQKTKLVIPSIVTTRSELAHPEDLFKAAPTSHTSSSTGGH